MNYLAIILAILPILLIGTFYYLIDTSKEPKNLLLNLFSCGIVAALIVISISYITLLIFPNYNNLNNNFFKIVLYYFFFVALIEEVTKWIMVYKVSYNLKENDQMYDIILYSVFVSLGFAAIENLIYIAPAINGVYLAIFRALTAIPAHAIFGTFIGYYLSFYKKEKKKKYFILSLLIPIILHGIYDLLIYSTNNLLILIFLIFITIIFIITFIKINKVLKYDKKALINKSN